MSLQEASQPKATVGIPEVAPPDVVPAVSAKRQRSAPNVNDQELVAANVNDIEVDFDALDALFTNDTDSFDFGNSLAEGGQDLWAWGQAQP